MCLSKRMTRVGSQWKRGQQKTDSESQARLMNDSVWPLQRLCFVCLFCYFVVIFFVVIFFNEAGSILSWNFPLLTF